MAKVKFGSPAWRRKYNLDKGGRRGRTRGRPGGRRRGARGMASGKVAQLVQLLGMVARGKSPAAGRGGTRRAGAFGAFVGAPSDPQVDASLSTSVTAPDTSAPTAAVNKWTTPLGRRILLGRGLR